MTSGESSLIVSGHFNSLLANRASVLVWISGVPAGRLPSTPKPSVYIVTFCQKDGLSPSTGTLFGSRGNRSRFQ